MRKLIYFIGILGLGFLFSNKTLAEEYNLPAAHGIAVEVQSGKILYEKEATTPTHIASISKLLSVYLVYEAIEKGDLTLDTPVPISDYAYGLTLDYTLSNVNLDRREYTVRELLTASLINSANSAIIALAEKVAGSEPAFVDKMKEKLASWGIRDAFLVNATGVNNSNLGESIYPGSSKEDENKLSAIAVATIARRLLLDFPEVVEITSQYAYQLDGIEYYSTNKMLAEGSHAREGVVGLKTGTTDLAGSSFVATTTQNQMQIITVVLHADGSDVDPDARFTATNSLMNYVYDTYSTIPFVNKGKSYGKSKVAVFDGKKEFTPAVAEKDLMLTIRNDSTKKASATFKPSVDVTDAPVKKGTPLGILTLKDTDLVGKGYLEEQPSVTMVVPKDIEKPLFFISWWNHFVRYVNEKL